MTLAIAARGLEKVYKGNVAALAGVDLDVKVGIFTLLGPNGTGKTTLMRILTTQFKPTSGEAHIFELDVVREGAEVRKVIGYVPQETSVWSDINAMRTSSSTLRYMVCRHGHERRSSMTCSRAWGCALPRTSS